MITSSATLGPSLLEPSLALGAAPITLLRLIQQEVARQLDMQRDLLRLAVQRSESQALASGEMLGRVRDPGPVPRCGGAQVRRAVAMAEAEHGDLATAARLIANTGLSPGELRLLQSDPLTAMAGGVRASARP